MYTYKHKDSLFVTNIKNKEKDLEGPWESLTDIY